MMKETTSKPVAVLISDIHYNIQTLEVADKALRMAVNKANDLNVALIIAGDLHDTKANIRGECIKAIMATIREVSRTCYVLRGNHDQINEKSEDHSLEFLREMKNVVILDRPMKYNFIGINLAFIPYQHSSVEFMDHLSLFSCLSQDPFVVIAHQGIIGSEAGHYIQDKSAIAKQDVASFRVISGHYHRRQTIQLLDNGTFDYIGNPYTLGFAEANDPEKGFQVLYDDGSLEFVPTNLRKHIIYDITYEQAIYRQGHVMPGYNKGDIVWFKVRGPSDKLALLDKKLFSSQCDFRLDLIPTETNTSEIEMSNDTPQDQILDSLIESLQNVDEDRKARLKNLWKQLT